MIKHEPILPEDWTREQVEAVGDFFWAIYEHLIDVLCVHYPAAVMGTRTHEKQPPPTPTERSHVPPPHLDDIPY
jgi:hypothetical protein